MPPTLAQTTHKGLTTDITMVRTIHVHSPWSNIGCADYTDEPTTGKVSAQCMLITICTAYYRKVF